MLYEYDCNSDGHLDASELRRMEEEKKQERETRLELQKKRLERPDYSDNII